MIIITSKKDGFRRCGVAHPAAPTEYPEGTFTPDQIKTMRNEPMLVVLEADGAGDPSGKQVVAEALAAVKAAATGEALDALADGEKRKQVLSAIESRRKELAA